MKKLTTIKMSAVGILIAVSLQASGQSAPVRSSYAPYFTEAKAGAKAPDADGFIQRWLLLEPIKNSLRGNTGFNEQYIRGAFYTDYFPNQFTVVPKNGDKVKVNDVELTWHALDTTNFNAKLFRFAGMMKKDVYGITCWAVTVIDCPQEIKNVRLAVGSNSASMWWVNGEEEVALFGDRRMVMDDGVSERLTLKKGVNIVRGAVINGPGLSDMCVRFIDDAGNPIKNYTINLDKAGN